MNFPSKNTLRYLLLNLCDISAWKLNVIKHFLTSYLHYQLMMMYCKLQQQKLDYLPSRRASRRTVSLHHPTQIITSLHSRSHGTSPASKTSNGRSFRLISYLIFRNGLTYFIHRFPQVDEVRLRHLGHGFHVDFAITWLHQVSQTGETSHFPIWFISGILAGTRAFGCRLWFEGFPLID